MPPAGTELGNWDKYEKCCAEFWVKMNNDKDKLSNCGDCCVTHGLGGLASLKSAPFTATSFTCPQEQQLDSQMTKSYVLSRTFKKCDMGLFRSVRRKTTRLYNYTATHQLWH